MVIIIPKFVKEAHEAWEGEINVLGAYLKIVKSLQQIKPTPTRKEINSYVQSVVVEGWEFFTDSYTIKGFAEDVRDDFIRWKSGEFDNNYKK